MEPKNALERLLLQLDRELQRNHGRITKVNKALRRHRGYLRSTIEQRRSLKVDILLEALAELRAEPRQFFAQAYEIVPTSEELLSWQEKPGAVDPSLRRIEEATLNLEAEGPPAGEPSTDTRPRHRLKKFARSDRANQRKKLRQESWPRNPEVLRTYLHLLDATRTDRAPNVAAVAETVAVEIIPVLTCPQEERLELQCLVIGIFGSAKRVAADYATSARALGFAMRLAGRHGLDTTRAALLQRGAYLLRDDAAFDRALLLLQEALNIYAEHRLPIEYGKAMIDRAAVFTYTQEYERAENVYRVALEFLKGDDESQRQNRLLAAQGIALCRLHMGDLVEAERWIQRAIELLDPADTGSLAKLTWQRGLLAYKRKQYREAELLISDARRILQSRENPIQGALVGLDLAKTLLAQGKTREVLDLAMEMNPLLFLFRANKLAEAALRIFIRAALQGQVTERLIERSADSLRKACSRSRARPGKT